MFGCTIEQACNYNPEATVDDGSCDFTSCLNFGCTDDTACNYDPEAQFNDGSCEYANFPYDCEGDCVNDDDGDGVCNEFEVPGCTDEALATTTRRHRRQRHLPVPRCAWHLRWGLPRGRQRERRLRHLRGLRLHRRQRMQLRALASLEDGSCLYPEANYDCDGNCLDDMDGDGV